MSNAEGTMERETVKLWPRHIFGVAGLTLFFSWVFSLMNSSMYLLLSNVADDFIVKEMFICSALVMAILVWLISKFSAFNNITITILLVVSAMPVIAELFGLLGFLPFEASITLWILSGAGTTALFIFWGLFISSFEFKKSGLYPMVGLAAAVIIATCISLLGPSHARYLTILFPAWSLFSYFIARSYRSSGKSDSFVAELKSFNAKPSQTDSVLITPMIITVINSVCLGFSVYYLFISSSYENHSNTLIFCFVLLVLCAIRIVDFVKIRKIGSLFSALTILPYVAICILPLSFLDARFWTVSCSIMLCISGLNVIINRSAVFVFAERSNKVSPLFFLYDCMGTIAGIGIGFFCSYLVFGNVFTGQIENIYAPSILVIVITIIWTLISRKNLEKQLVFYEPSNDLGVGDNGDSFSSWHEKLEEFSNYYNLSPRQYEVLLLLAKGRNASYIKDKLVISNHTAKAHIYNIYQKTSVNSRQELISLIEGFSGRKQ